MKILHIHLDPPGNHYGTGNFYRKINESLNKKNIFGTNICCDRYMADTFCESNIILIPYLLKYHVYSKQHIIKIMLYSLLFIS